jgi:hypothetical protein
MRKKANKPDAYQRVVDLFKRLWEGRKQIQSCTGVYCSTPS